MRGSARRWSRRATSLATVMGMAAGLAVPSTHAEDVRGHGIQKLMGLNIDLFSSANDGTAPDVGYAPQVWFGIGRERLSFVDDTVVLPAAVGVAIDWFAGAGTTTFDPMIGDPSDADFDAGGAGARFAMWRRAIARDGVVHLTWRRTESLRVRCGHHWWLPIDSTSSVPIEGVWLPCSGPSFAR